MPAKVTVDWDAVRADPVLFTTTFLRHPDGSPCIPHPAQETIMRNFRRNTDIITGRQFGKSTVCEWLPTWFGVTHPNRTIMVMAPTLDQARIIFNGIVEHFRKPPFNKMVVGKIKNSPFPEFTINNGTRYMARGLNSPEYVRGNRVHLGVLDEASFVKEGVIAGAVEPMFTVTGKEEDSALIKISSPFGDGEFKQSWDASKRRAKTVNENYGAGPRNAWFHYTSYDNPHADTEYLEEVKERYGEDSPIWLAEYMGVFVDGDTQVFPTADIKWAYEQWPEGVKPPILPKDAHRYVQGTDLANRRDYFVSTILDITNRDAVMWNRMERFRRRGYEYYKSVIKQNYLAYNRAKTIVDSTSLGESFVEELQTIGVPAEGYAYAGTAAKHEVVQELARMLSEHRLILPFDKDIITELAHFQYKITDAKVLRMEAPKNEHDDIVMSLALAAHLACIPVTLGTFRIVDLSPARPKQRTPNPWAGLFDDEEETA